jgi:hypothetical protein
MDVDMAVLRAELTRDEARTRYLYDDKAGPGPFASGMTLRGKLTGGVGWNFSANGIPDPVIELLLTIGIENAAKACDHVVPGWTAQLDPVRQRAFVNMAFTMGVETLGGFKHFVAAFRAGDYALAGGHIEDSDWWRGAARPRAERIKRMIETGTV